MKTDKFEVQKGQRSFYYTGKLERLSDGRVLIRTIKGERLKFWQEQIVGSEEVEITKAQNDMIGDDKNGESHHKH